MASAPETFLDNPVVVTAANPAPGRDIIHPYMVRSGTGWDQKFTTQSDGGPGYNVYIAGGPGASGSVIVQGTGAFDVTGSMLAEVSGVFNVTGSVVVPNAVDVTGSMVAQVSGTFDVTGTVRSVLQSEVGQVIGVASDGVPALFTQDELARNILKSILRELRMIRMQLETMTGEEISAEEVDT